jgi:cell division protease FtsH
MPHEPKNIKKSNVPPEDTPSNDGRGSKGPQPPPPVKFTRGLMSWVFIVALLIMLFVVLNGTNRGVPIKSWDQFAVYLERKPKTEDGKPVLDADGKPILSRNDLVENLVIIEDNRLVATVESGRGGFPPSEKGTQIFLPIDAVNRDWYLNELKTMGVDHRANTGTSVWMQLLVTLAPFVLVILLIWFFIARSMRSAGAGPGGMLGSFGKSKHRLSSKDTVNVTFNDVAGVDEAKEEVAEIVEFLKNPRVPAARGRRERAGRAGHRRSGRPHGMDAQPASVLPARGLRRREAVAGTAN